MSETSQQRADSIQAYYEFCERQQDRIVGDLRRRLARVARARGGDPESLTEHVIVTRRGYTTEASKPVDRKFQAQEQ